MTPEALAALHAECFDDAPRPWSAQEFAALLDGPGVFLLTRPAAFLLGRCIADEAELLTLAVAPKARRKGLGRALTQGFAETARHRGAASGFLEVAANNPAAQALYRGLNWQKAGQRPNYYGAGKHALILRLILLFHQESS